MQIYACQHCAADALKPVHLLHGHELLCLACHPPLPSGPLDWSLANRETDLSSSALNRGVPNPSATRDERYAGKLASSSASRVCGAPAESP
jgi:hypothetical protein